MKTYFRLDYRGICNLLLEMDDICSTLGLKQIPHFTTLQKFLKRFNTMLFDKLISHVINSFEDVTVAVDATGFTSSYSSKYYVKRINMDSKSKHFLKSTIAIDVKNQLILAMKLRKSPSNDNKDFKPILKKTNKIVDVKMVLADKGYDSENNLCFVKNNLNAEPIIPVRGGNSSPLKSRNGGKLRKKMYLSLEKDPAVQKKYHQRSKVETVFSVIKRKFGDELYARNINMRKKEVKLKHLVYNLYRKIIFYWMFSTQPININVNKYSDSAENFLTS